MPAADVNFSYSISVFNKHTQKKGINTLFAINLLAGRKIHTIRTDEKGLWEQHKYVLAFNYKTFTKRKINTEIQHPSESAAFRTAADRDKCIEEIKAIMEKYSKK